MATTTLAERMLHEPEPPVDDDDPSPPPAPEDAPSAITEEEDHTHPPQPHGRPEGETSVVRRRRTLADRPATLRPATLNVCASAYAEALRHPRLGPDDVQELLQAAQRLAIL